MIGRKRVGAGRRRQRRVSEARNGGFGPVFRIGHCRYSVCVVGGRRVLRGYASHERGFKAGLWARVSKHSMDGLSSGIFSSWFCGVELWFIGAWGRGLFLGGA